MILDHAIRSLEKKHDLSLDQTKDIFDAIFAGEANEAQIKATLLALRAKGETLTEIQGATASMRANMLPIHAPEGAMDIVGTGGDGHGTFNVSTAAAFVVAGAGVPVAKHGNKAASSLSGASDVLSKLGVNLDAPFATLEKSLNEIGIAFLFAPRHHFAMRYVGPVRKELGVRTIFNLLGPLTNPANVRLHLIGVFDPIWAKPMAETLAALGSRAAWVTHGADGLDELSSTTHSSVVTLEGGALDTRIVTPEEFGLPRATLADLKGGDPDHNALAVREILDGVKNPYRDIVLMNAAAALIVAGKAATYQDAMRLAAESIDSGAAKEKLRQLAAMTHG